MALLQAVIGLPVLVLVLVIGKTFYSAFLHPLKVIPRTKTLGSLEDPLDLLEHQGAIILPWFASA
ncbi:hypothetical protein MAP00_007413 [Monascus purpureus]|nr:hypothetical protein MAP00_007413 [Monascus purpureus]